MNLEMLVALGTVFTIGVSAIMAIYKIWQSIDTRLNTVDKNQIEQTIVLKSLVTEMIELKGYEPRISKNETDIALINLRCEINHKE